MSLKCPECHKRNVSQANYCRKCVHKFSKKEKEAMRLNGFWSMVNWVKDKWDNSPPGKLMDSFVVKLIIVLIPLLGGMWFFVQNGNALRIEESTEYTRRYNAETNDYYLLLSQEKSKLNLYVPHEIEHFYVKYYSESGELLEESSYDDLEDIEITVNNRNENNYYVISVAEDDRPENRVKTYVYRESQVEFKEEGEPQDGSKDDLRERPRDDGAPQEVEKKYEGERHE